MSEWLHLWKTMSFYVQSPIQLIPIHLSLDTNSNSLRTKSCIHNWLFSTLSLWTLFFSKHVTAQANSLSYPVSRQHLHRLRKSYSYTLWRECLYSNSWSVKWVPTMASEMSSVNSLRTPCKNPKTKKQYSFHGGSLKSRSTLHKMQSNRTPPTLHTKYS